MRAGIDDLQRQNLRRSILEPRTKVRLGGLFILAIGLGGIVYNWYTVLTQGVYWQKASFLFPFFACLGLSLIIYPSSKAENLAKYGTEQLKWQHMPTGQKIIIIVGVVLGALQWAFFSGHLGS